VKKDLINWDEGDLTTQNLQSKHAIKAKFLVVNIYDRNNTD